MLSQKIIEWVRSLDEEDGYIPFVKKGELGRKNKFVFPNFYSLPMMFGGNLKG